MAVRCPCRIDPVKGTQPAIYSTEGQNLVIGTAENIRLGVVTFEDEGIATEDEPEETAGISYDFWALRDIVQNDDLPMAERDESVAQLQRLAEDGDPHAQYLIGKLWRDGPLLIPDWFNARYWFTQAAEQGSGAAQYALSKLLSPMIQRSGTQTRVFAG